jgi:hypothetical protein
MKFRIIIFLVLKVAVSSHATTISQWTFEINTPADLNNSATITGVAADGGNGTASGFHSSAASDWSTPAGNGSANSLSVNTWNVNDYFQFQLNTVGFTGISVSFDQTSSSTGPGLFNFAYSTDGTTFTTFATSYSVSADSGSWNSSTAKISDIFSFDLSGAAVLNDAPDVYFRIIDATTNSAGGGTVLGTGTDRIDNFTVSGTKKATEAVVAVPDTLPSSFAAMIFLGLLFVSRRVVAQMSI